MTFVDVMQEYFRGEKELGVLLVVVGVGLLAGAAWAFRTQSGGFAWGLVVPLVLVGLAYTKALDQARTATPASARRQTDASRRALVPPASRRASRGRS